MSLPSRFGKLRVVLSRTCHPNNAHCSPSPPPAYSIRKVLLYRSLQPNICHIDDGFCVYSFHTNRITSSDVSKYPVLWSLYHRPNPQQKNPFRLDITSQNILILFLHPRSVVIISLVLNNKTAQEEDISVVHYSIVSNLFESGSLIITVHLWYYDGPWSVMLFVGQGVSCY